MKELWSPNDGLVIWAIHWGYFLDNWNISDLTKYSLNASLPQQVGCCLISWDWKGCTLKRVVSYFVLQDVEFVIFMWHTLIVNWLESGFLWSLAGTTMENMPCHYEALQLLPRLLSWVSLTDTDNISQLQTESFSKWPWLSETLKACAGWLQQLWECNVCNQWSSGNKSMTDTQHSLSCSKTTLQTTGWEFSFLTYK